MATVTLRKAGTFALAACLIAAACSAGDETALTDEEVGSTQQGLSKPRGTNGDADYCNNAAALCLPGEGDCDSHAQCAGGAICAANVGVKFLLPWRWDMCVPAHCVNNVLDGDEQVIDCGGSCSAPGFDCGSLCDALPVGDSNFCSLACPCASGQGDCDDSSQCQPGLSCAMNNGPQFGFPVGHDVCVPAHCKNRVRDVDETFTDCGGSCSSPSFDCTSLCDRYPPGHARHCSIDCPCAIGAGDCDNASHCQPGLVCSRGRGPAYGTTGDVCTPAHCTNGVQDEQETAIDVGGECGGCSGPGGIGPCSDAPPVGAACPDGVCEAGARCLSGTCLRELGWYEPCGDCPSFGGDLPCVCGDGLECYWDSNASTDTCQGQYAATDESCLYRPCAPGLHCDTGDFGEGFFICLSAGGPYEHCPDIGECDPGTYCDISICIPID